MLNLSYKILITAVVKGGAVIVGFLLTVVISRTHGADQAGLFFLGFSLLAALSVLFRFGLDDLVLRTMGAEAISSSANERLCRGFFWIALTTLPFAFLVCVSSNQIASVIFNKPNFSPILAIFIWALPAMSLFTILGVAFQGLHRFLVATVYQKLGLSILFLLLTTLIWWFYPNHLNATLSSAIYSVSAWVVCFSAFIFWFRQPQTQFILPSLLSPEQWQSSSNLWVVAIMGLLVQWSGVLVAGAFADATELAYLSVAQRTALLTSFVLMVVNMVVAPRYAKLWSDNNLVEIRRLALLSTRGMILVMLPIVGVMIFLPSQIMRLFGEGFDQGSILLTIMALGQFINVATGSVGYLLSMSGHERDLRKVTLFSGPLTIVCAVVLTYYWGVLGAAIATAIGLAVQNLLALLMVKKRLGFWSIG